MATIAKLDSAFTLAGKRVVQTVTLSNEAAEVQEVDLPAAIAGTLTTRTNDTSGVLTVPTGHGITSSDTIGLFWAETGYRVNVDVSATTGTTITFQTGGGDNLPLVSTAIVVSKVVTSALTLNGDNLVAWAAGGKLRASIEFLDDAADVITYYHLPEKQGLIWSSVAIGANPLASAITSAVRLYNGDVEANPFVLSFLKSTV